MSLILFRKIAFERIIVKQFKCVVSINKYDLNNQVVRKMCIAKPYKVVKTEGNKALIQVGEGELALIDLSLVDAKEGDYVIINMGFAIQVLSEEEAKESLDLWEKFSLPE